MIIGIDLGTTNSLAAYFTEDGPKIIPNRLGENITPSVVSIDEEGQIYVGKTAKERMYLYPDTCAGVFKRNMGTEKEYILQGKKFRAEELSSFVLRALKEDAESFLGEEVTEAVISVPAYFNDARRRATKKAGELAGLKVERIISEPTAAAIAYGLYQNSENSKFLVFDLGGGTFDVSILELYDKILEVSAVAGDNYLGGEDFTNVIEDMFFKKYNEIDRFTLTQKEAGYIHKQADLCKMSFGNEKSSVMTVNLNDKTYEMTVSISEYEEKLEELFERIRSQIKRSLSDSNLKLSSIAKVILIGGATKLSIIRRFVAKIFRTIPDTSINPDEAVALGAAIQAAMKERHEGIKEVILTDVCPFTLGTEVVVERENGRFENGHFCPIIERNTVIPASRTERLYTAHDNQTCIRVNVLQGESRFAVNNVSLGEMLINVPKGKAGAEGVDVTYTYDVNSILEVIVKVVSTGKEYRQVIKNQESDMTDEQIEERLKELSYLKIHPREKEENKLLLLRGERMYEEKLGSDRLIIEEALRKFEAALDSQDNNIAEAGKKEFKEFLEEFSDWQ